VVNSPSDSFFSFNNNGGDGDSSVGSLDCMKKTDICCWNIHGLANKLQDLTGFFDYLKEFDIFFLIETWIKKDFDVFNVSSRLTTFDLKWVFAEQTATRGRAKGGMLIGVNKNLKKNWHIDYFNDIIFLRFLPNGLIVLPMYLPPFSWDDAFEKYNDFFNKFDLQNCLCLGDLNARIGCLDNYILDTDVFFGRNFKDNFVNARGRKLVAMCDDFDFVLLNGRGFNDQTGNFTFINANGQSTIDYGFIGRQVFELVTDFFIPNRMESDHLPLVVNLNLKKKVSKQVELEQLVPRLNWLLQDEEVFKSAVGLALKNFDFEIMSVSESVDCVVTAIHNNAKVRKPNKFYIQKWFDLECFKARSIFKKALVIFSKFSTDENHDDLCKKKDFFKTL